MLLPDRRRGAGNTCRVCEWTSSSRERCFQSEDLSEIVSRPSTFGADEAPVITVDTTRRAQTIKGFGTCFNELGWQSLRVLPQDQLRTVFSELFEPGRGACLNRGRLSMGANDFAMDFYSVDEVEDDFELRHYTIERDKKTLIPMLKWALEYQPDLYLFVSPWCPPLWMKTTGHYAERAVTAEMVSASAISSAKAASKVHGKPRRFRSIAVENDAVPGEEGWEGHTSFKMEDRYLKAYAGLFGKFVDAYRDEGIYIRMVMPQNEMNSAQNFPSCCWTSKDLNTFIGRYLGPEMERRGCDVYFGTEERPNHLLVDTLLTDPLSSRYIKGVAFQWAGKKVLPVIAQKYPDLDMVESEQECGNGLNNWEGALHSWDLQRHYLSNGVTQYYYWNTSLFADKPSRWGWYQNSLITVNEKDGSWTFTPEYFELKQLSYYVRAGARRIVTEGYKDVLCFVNPDGSVVVVVANQSTEPLNVILRFSGRDIRLTLRPESVNSIVLR